MAQPGEANHTPGSDLSVLIAEMPKVELHLHLEGTLEPEMMLALAERNGVSLPWPDVDAARSAYEFSDLQSFLDIYYTGAGVLTTSDDFHDLTGAYLDRMAAEGVRHVEVFFDPQTHTGRGIPYATALDGISDALGAAQRDHGISSALIPCVLRHLPAADAMAMLDDVLEHGDRVAGLGLDSSELGFPPTLFTAVFERARAAGLRTVAHAGEEGPPSYITEALDLLRAERIDHGVRCLEDRAVVDRLVDEQVPLTVCPLSNVRLAVVDDLAHHPLRRLLDAGLVATVNSDDPAYFGGYLTQNYLDAEQALDLGRDRILQLAGNAIAASFLDGASKARLRADLDAVAARHPSAERLP